MKTLIALIVSTVVAIAADDRQNIAKLTTLAGKTFDQVKVSKVTAVEIRFTHATGIASVPLADLPPDMQKLFGYDPVAADFEMVNVQEERRQALIADEKRKADHAALLAKQKSEHSAIKAIEAKGVKLSLVVRSIAADSATCAVMRVRLVEMNGKSINGKKVAAKKKMNGEYELTEELVPMPGADPYEIETLIIMHGLEKPVVGRQFVRVVYPCAYNAKGVATHYAADADMAYGILKQKLASH